MAEREVWANTDEYRRKMIIDAKNRGVENDGILKEFTRKVVELAENEEHKFTEKHPKVPESKLAPVTQEEIIKINC